MLVAWAELSVVGSRHPDNKVDKKIRVTRRGIPMIDICLNLVAINPLLFIDKN
jgi:hypothetical protein